MARRRPLVAAAAAPALALLLALGSTLARADDAAALPPLAIPVAGVSFASLRDTYADGRPGHRHEAIDIAAPRGTPVLAAADGTVAKLFSSVPGGLTLYQFESSGRYALYYAHLDRYADGVRQGMVLRQGDVIGYVGSTGNASVDAPHLHFAAFLLGPERRWWQGTAVNPFPQLGRALTR